MGEALIQGVSFIVGAGLSIFGFMGVFAAARGWGDEDVTTGDYLVYGVPSLAVGLLVLGVTMKGAGL